MTVVIITATMPAKAMTMMSSTRVKPCSAPILL